MDITYETLKIPGLTKRIRLFQITDSHLTLSNPDESDEIRNHAAARTNVFHITENFTDEILDEMVEASGRLSSDCVLFTGDIIDFPSEANLYRLKQVLDSIPSHFYIPGNHDWVFPADDPEEDTLKRNRRARLRTAVGCPLEFVEKDLGEVILVGIDNGNYHVTPEQLERTKAALERGKPVVFCCHIPLYLESLCPRVLEVWRAPIMMGSPAEICEGRPFWGNNLFPDEITRRFAQMIRDSDAVAAVLTGHLHFSHKDFLAPGKPQFVTDFGPRNCAMVLDLIP